MMRSNRKILPLSPRLILIFLRGLRRAFKGLQIRDVTKISSCQENTKSTRGIRQLGISFGSIFLLSSYERSWGHIIEAREMGWGLYLRGIVTRTGEALPNKLLIAAILNKIPFKPDQNKYYRNYNYCIMHWMVLFPINSTIHLLNKITRSWRNFHCVLWVLLGQRKDKGNSESNSSKLYTGLTRGINLGFSETAHLLLP